MTLEKVLIPREMKKAGLVDPIIEELDNPVKITLRHKKIASLEDIILNYLIDNPGNEISNKTVRQISGEDDVNKVKKAFQRLREIGKIEPVDPQAHAFKYTYKLKG